jgi:photosystem II stability/assembly factor-like uncharacterized protein
MKKSLLVLSIAALSASAHAQQANWRSESVATTASMRGLSVVSATVAWASGTKGTVLRTTDGEHWQVMQVDGADKLDFRDIHAVDARRAVAMSAGPGDASRVYRTDDGGASWQLQASNTYAEGFWDALAFWDRDNGLMFGDAVKGSFQLYRTSDGGKSWAEIKARGLEAMPNEGAFAASGTCLVVGAKGEAWIASGGAARARVFHTRDRGATWQASSTPIPAGAPAKGIFSLAFLNNKVGIAAGGDYQQAGLAALNGARTDDGGISWTPAPILPAGFMSVVVPVPGAGNSLVAGGLAGSGYSRDGGKSWTVLSTTPLNTLAFATPTVGWAVGPKGLLMKYTGPALTQ